jgi:hypothetical protein
MSVASNGYLGIGTTAPGFPLSVVGHGGSAAYSGYYFHSAGGGTLQWTNSYGLVTAYIQYDLVVDGAIGSASDARIKKDIEDITDTHALEILRALKPRTYKYKDQTFKSKDNVYGFIAQEIRDVFPEATKMMRESIPNIMFMTTIQNCIIQFDTALLEYDDNNVVYNTLVVYGPYDEKIELTITSVIDSNSVQVQQCDELESFLDGKIYVHGQIVDNFLAIEKSYIYTTAVAALQEVDRQLQAEKVKNVDMLARLEALEAKHNDTMISTYTRDDYLFKLIMPIGNITLKKAIIEHADITGDYKLKKLDGTLIGIFNGLNVIESHEFASNGIVKFMMYDMSDNILPCDTGTADVLVIV